jgi:pyrroline-5-carboxylate reductase
MSLGGSASKEDGDLIAKLFGSVGKMWRADEKLFDAITGLRYMASVNAYIRAILFNTLPHKTYIQWF